MRKTPGHSSFQKKLLGAFLGVGVIPLLVCVFLILNLFHLSLARNAENLAESQLTAMTGGLTELLAACGGVLEDLSGQGEVGMALTRGALRDTQIYSALYDTAAPLLRNADFSLYDGEGKLLYTTGNGRLGETLPVKLAAGVLGMVSYYAFGTAWYLVLYASTGSPVGLMTALGYCVFPFVIPDLLKLGLALLLARRVGKYAE